MHGRLAKLTECYGKNGDNNVTKKKNASVFANKIFLKKKIRNKKTFLLFILF